MSLIPQWDMNPITLKIKISKLENEIKVLNVEKQELESLVKEILEWTKYKDSNWARRAKIILKIKE